MCKMPRTWAHKNLLQPSGNKIKPTNERFGLWFLLENLQDINLISDIGDINYTKGAPLLMEKNFNSLTQITDPFCVNIMVVKICDQVDCEEQLLEKKKKLILKKALSAWKIL